MVRGIYFSDYAKREGGGCHDYVSIKGIFSVKWGIKPKIADFLRNGWMVYL